MESLNLFEIGYATIGFLCSCIGPFFLLILGAVIGTLTEQAHFRRIEARERQTAHIPALDIRVFLGTPDPAAGGMLVTSEVVIASDYLKNFIAYFVKFVGGEIIVYEALMKRARREAVLRLKENAVSKGYNALANMRLETSDVGMIAGTRAGVAVAIVASATAYRINA